MTMVFVMNGPDKGRSFQVDDETIYVGRDPENHIQLKDKSVSRRHLQIERRPKSKDFRIKDLRSKNGTFLNGVRINAGEEYEVGEGVPISVGGTYISLNKPLNGVVLALQDSIDLSRQLEETLIIDYSVDEPKNLRFIYKVASMLMQSLKISEILEKMLGYIFDLFQRIDRGVILLVDAKTGRIGEVISKTAEGRDLPGSKYSRTIVDRVLREGKAVIMSDTLSEDEMDRSASMEIMKVRSVMCVPLISKSRIRGVIYVDSLNTPYGFQKEDLSALIALSGPAALAIENALLYSNLEKLVEERTKSLQVTEDALRVSQARFKAMFDHMRSGVVVYRKAEGTDALVVLDMNRAAERIEGRLKGEVLSKDMVQAFPGVRDSGLLEVLKNVLLSGSPQRCSITLQEADKVVSWRDYYVYRLPSGEVVTIYDDVTEIKRAELEQRVLQDQLLHSQRMESIGTLAGGTAHNFRNILQAISGNIEYLEMVYSDKPEVLELSKSIYDSVEKGVALINSLLQFSRRGDELQAYDFVSLDLGEVIRRTYEIIEKVFNKNIELSLEVDRGLYVKGNHSHLSQVFMNLFMNARDAMPEGGRLKVIARKEGKKVVATVTDTGQGMDKAVLEKIFDPFFTLKEVGKGTGLGLSTAHGIVEQHRGSISVRSKPGEGSTFTLAFPLVDVSAVTKIEREKKVLFGKGEKVLIVDDERQALDSLSKLVKRLGYQPIPVDRAVEALGQYEESKPEVVLMDRSMPEMDGDDCIRRLVKTDPGARIIVVSGYDEYGPNGIDQDVKDTIKGYLTKPCGLEELSRAISQALETSP